ncbi:MAG: hypothetical protein IPM16_08285 [Chloroflexi bacterium]|nr:hypothetical protein [Chloroflexota bacterium]
MIEKFVVPLGGRGTASLPAHDGVRALDRAVRAGMPVPSGHLVLPALADLAVLHGALSIDGGRIEVLDPSVVALWLDGAGGASSAVWVKPIHATERVAQPKVVQRVSPEDVLSAVVAVWQDHLRVHADATIQPVLIQHAPAIEQHGQAWTSAGIGRDLVAIATGSRYHETALERLFGWERVPNPPDLEPILARVQALLRDVRRWLGGEHWHVEWADDGTKCWLLSVHPCESGRSRAATMTLVPVSGSGGGPLTPLVADVCRQAEVGAWSRATNVEGGLSEMPAPACVAHGRLYVDASDVATALQAFGLGTTLLLPFAPDAHRVLLPPRTGRLVRSLGRGTALRLLVAHLMSILTMPRLLVLDAPARDAQALVDLFDQTADLYGIMIWRLSHLWLAATAAAGEAGQTAILTALRGMGDPTRLAARAKMRDLAADYLSVRKSIDLGDVPEKEEFQVIWGDYLRRWGIRADNEVELACMRDHEQPASVLRDVVFQVDASPQGLHGLKRVLMRPLLARASRLGEAFARDLDTARQAWLAAANWLVEQSLIVKRDDVWLLTRADLGRLAIGWRPEGEFWARRRAAWEALQSEDAEPTIDRIFCSEQAKSLDTPRG